MCDVSDDTDVLDLYCDTMLLNLAYLFESQLHKLVSVHKHTTHGHCLLCPAVHAIIVSPCVGWPRWTG